MIIFSEKAFVDVNGDTIKFNQNITPLGFGEPQFRGQARDNNEIFLQILPTLSLSDSAVLFHIAITVTEQLIFIMLKNACKSTEF